MRIRASVVTIAKVLAVLVVASAAVGCTHASGKLMVDAPKLLKYEPPDIDEITGIDSEDEPAEAAGGSGSAQNQQQTPPK